MFGCMGKQRKQILVIRKTTPFHLRALLGRNENSFTWNFSLKKPNADFSLLEEQMGVVFSPYSQASDPAPQLVSGHHLLGNVHFSR